MERRLVFGLFISFLTIQSCLAQDDSRPWERLGLSQTEWKMILDSNMPMDKVEFLLKDGIGISEYLGRPWEKLNITEAKWVEKRRSGMTNYDIELESSTNKTEWRKDIGSGLRSDMGGMSENNALIASLGLPGYQQFRMNRKPHGYTMAGLAVGAVGWCVAGSIAKRQFEYVPIGVILIPDMVWSMIDFKLNGSDAQK